MNLLTDIIRDVAADMKVNMSKDDELRIQENAVAQIVREVSWIKHTEIMKEGMPWLEKKREKVA